MSVSSATDRDVAASGCPVRKLTRPDDQALPLLEEATGPDRWVVRSFDLARQVMRQSEGVAQAGFGAETIERAGSGMRPPILYLEGAPHRAQRKAAARLFAPKVTEDYRAMMESLSDELVGRLRTDKPVDLSRLTLRMAVEVAAQVVGLTNSSLNGMSRRLDSFFEGDPTHVARDPRALLATLRHSSALFRFYWLDVKPAIRARRKQRASQGEHSDGSTGEHRGEDVISQLIDADFGDLDILTECVTYGAAGMVTTREFISVAVWHLLDHPELLDRYRRAEMDERLAILNETLRLEPVVGHLYRRTTAPLTLDTADGPREVAVGTLIDLDVRAVNADAATVGAEPLGLCPDRSMPRAVPPTVMSFGDGHHRCPGAPIAIMETEVFVSTLLRFDVVADAPPQVEWNALTHGYDLNEFWIRRRS